MVRIGLPNRLKGNGGSQDDNHPSSRSSSPMRNNQCLMLKITVMKGRNLAAKDKRGTSDPFLVINLGDAKQSTPAINKTLNPEWYTSFDLPILGTQSLLIEAVCWDKDRFGKDYLGEFDVALEDIFANGQIAQDPRWYTLKSKRKGGKKGSNISGDIQLQFALADPHHPSASPTEIISKLRALTIGSPDEDDAEIGDLSKFESRDDDDDDDEDEDQDADTSDETDDPAKPAVAAEKRKKKLRLAKLKRKTKARAYEFTGGGSDCVGIAFIEISRVTDLPPERNVTRTSFDMDPFVVASLGRKTYRTRVVRHNLNPRFDEKMVFQVMRNEQKYSLSFSVIDRDTLSGNDFIASANFPLSTLTSCAPEADPETGLYALREPADPVTLPAPSKSRFRLPISRSSSASNLNKLSRPGTISRNSQSSASASPQPEAPAPLTGVVNDPSNLSPAPTQSSAEGDDVCQHPYDPDLKSYTIPLLLKHKDKWDDRHPTQLIIKAKYLPYSALRQQFWRSMLKQYDADESARISKVELTTMLDTLGSTLKESTIDGFFHRFMPGNGEQGDLTFDQAVICLEDQLQRPQKRTWGDTARSYIPNKYLPDENPVEKQTREVERGNVTYLSDDRQDSVSDHTALTALSVNSLGSKGEAGDMLERDDLADERGEEHVIEIRECPLCHQPRLNKRSDADIITHIATCASQDWRQVNNIVMAGFVTSSQAQRKWYSKVITKISYGGYKLGANSANILVQDRITGQINEERMSVYVRLGIRLLYKGLKSRDMETKRIRKLLKSLSIKQGKKFDDPASAQQIPNFINFHRLDMSEVLMPESGFSNFNEFFYRALKPNARPCSAPENARIIVSPADCRSVVFNQLNEATSIWVKGREFSIARLLGNAYPEDAKRYVNGALGIFRLAPQDYHRFHIPVDGILEEPRLIEGEYYTVNPMAIRSALDVYGENIRVVVPINSTAHGRVMVICVGAMMVGSTVITRKAGERVARAEELGYFKFGGSTILLLFEPGVMNFDEDLTANSNGALETLLSVGMSIGHHPDQAPFAPDMRKKEENVTNEERQEAKRRIGGSLSPSDGGTVPPL